MTDYLNQDDPVLRASAERRARAAAEITDRALRSGVSFRLEFEPRRLERAIGTDMQTLIPDPDRIGSASPYAVYDGRLDAERRPLLARILSLDPQGYAERPLNYIKSVRILDAAGKTLLRGGDHNTFILFALPAPDRLDLVAALRRGEIPESAIEQVDVDMERLQP